MSLARFSGERNGDENDFPAADFVRVDLAGLDQFLELIVPDLQTPGNSDDGDRRRDRVEGDDRGADA